MIRTLSRALGLLALLTTAAVAAGSSSSTGGSGTVRSVATSCGLTGGTITTTGTVSGSTTIVNASTASAYSFSSTDCGKLIVFSDSTSRAPSLAAMTAGTTINVLNLGTGTQTITGSSATINGGGSVAMFPGQGMTLVSDGTNWNAGGGAGPLVSSGSITSAVRTVTTSPNSVSATTDYLLCVTTSTTNITLNLPASPATGLTYLVKDCTGTASTHNVTISPAAGTIDGAASYVLSTNFGSVGVTYTGSQWSLN